MTSLWCTLVNPFVVVHPTRILMHPRVHRAHRLKSADLDQYCSKPKQGWRKVKKWAVPRRSKPLCIFNAISYPLYTALWLDWCVSDSSPLAYFRERTRELVIGTLLHCKELHDLFRALGLWYCESWGMRENEKVKADSTTQRCFL